MWLFLSSSQLARPILPSRNPSFLDNFPSSLISLFITLFVSAVQYAFFVIFAPFLFYISMQLVYSWQRLALSCRYSLRSFHHLTNCLHAGVDFWISFYYLICKSWRIFFRTENAKNLPILAHWAYFVASLRTFGVLFTGLSNAAAYYTSLVPYSFAPQLV